METLEHSLLEKDSKILEYEYKVQKKDRVRVSFLDLVLVVNVISSRFRTLLSIKTIALEPLFQNVLQFSYISKD